MVEFDRLKEKLVKLRDKLNLIFKEIDDTGLSNEYNTFLDEVSNPDLKLKCNFIFTQKFLVERIERDKEGIDNYVYYG